MIRVAITGPESSGKSELAVELSRYFIAPFAPEYAREYLSKRDGKYALKDLDAIAAGQLRYEVHAVAKASKLCFFDTDMLVMEVWSEFRFGKVSPFIQKAMDSPFYSLHLLCYPDLEWTDDALRESPDLSERLELFQLYEAKLKEVNVPYFIVKGKGKHRWHAAADWIKEILGKN